MERNEARGGTSVDLRHAFVVASYGRSPHLEECLASLAAQEVPSRIIVCTSTPFDGISELAAVYGADVWVHSNGGSIARDWNEALGIAQSVGCDWVTIAHQDDLYLPTFSATLHGLLARHPDLSMVFTGYKEITDLGPRKATLPILLKRVLIELGFVGGSVARHPFMKTNALRFGCAIPCPSVSLSTGIPGFPKLFDEDFGINLDWALWLRLAGSRDAGFGYVRRALLLHRIHPGSETSAGIQRGQRAAEDLRMFETLWARPIARVLSALYAFSYRFNSN